MRTDTIMRKIQEADIVISGIQAEESYNFAIDLNIAVEKIGKYSVMYYNRMENKGITYKAAQDKLGKYLRNNLTILVEEQ
jgi:hypothetical protein